MLFRSNVGRLVKITPTDGEKYVARIMAVNPRDLQLEIKGKESIVPFSDISRAHIEVEFNRKDVK